MLAIPIVWADAITCSTCGHFWHEVYSQPPHDGLERCEGGDVDCPDCNGVGDDPDDTWTPCRRCHGQGLLDWCRCSEFMPVDEDAFDAAQALWRV